jgi:hypothetical protein
VTKVSPTETKNGVNIKKLVIEWNNNKSHNKRGDKSYCKDEPGMEELPMIRVGWSLNKVRKYCS